MANGPVADTAVKPASRRAAKGARGCPTRPLGCGYERRTRQASHVAPGVDTSLVTGAGGRLQAVPAALPISRDRPATRASVYRAGAWIGGARRTGAALRSPRRAARPADRRRAGRSGVGAGDRCRTRTGRPVGRRPADPPARRGPQAAVRLLQPGRPDPVRPAELRAA